MTIAGLFSGPSDSAGLIFNAHRDSQLRGTGGDDALQVHQSSLKHVTKFGPCLLSDGSNTRYIEFLLNEFGPHPEDLLRLYTVECCVGFLSELGQPFNGNVFAATVQRKDHLESILNSL